MSAIFSPGSSAKHGKGNVFPDPGLSFRKTPCTEQSEKSDAATSFSIEDSDPVDNKKRTFLMTQNTRTRSASQSKDVIPACETSRTAKSGSTGKASPLPSGSTIGSSRSCITGRYFSRISTSTTSLVSSVTSILACPSRTTVTKATPVERPSAIRRPSVGRWVSKGLL